MATELIIARHVNTFHCAAENLMCITKECGQLPALLYYSLVAACMTESRKTKLTILFLTVAFLKKFGLLF